MTQVFSNNFVTTIAKDVKITDVNIFIAKVGGLPNIPDGGFLKVTFKRLSDGAVEVCKVTNVNSINSSLEVERGEEGTIPLKLKEGDRVSHNLTAQTLSDFSDTIENLSEKLSDTISSLGSTATEGTKGIIEIATQTETEAFIDDTRSVTPQKAKTAFLNQLDYGNIGRFNETVYKETILVDGTYTLVRTNGGIQVFTVDPVVTSVTFDYSLVSGDHFTLRLVDPESITVDWGNVAWVNDDIPNVVDGSFFAEFVNISGTIFGFHSGPALTPVL